MCSIHFYKMQTESNVNAFKYFFFIFSIRTLLSNDITCFSSQFFYPPLNWNKFNKFSSIITGAHENESDSNDDDWEEREHSRTHSVKFSEDSGTIDKDTPFVRQNTPHPKELKLKAHKLFSKEKTKPDDSGNLDTLSEEVRF